MPRRLSILLFALLSSMGALPPFAETAPEVIKMTGGSAQNIKPILDIDSEGRIWLAWQRNQGPWIEWWDIYDTYTDWDIYTRTYDSGEWSPETVVTDRRVGGISLDMATDENGNCWIGWKATDDDLLSQGKILLGAYSYSDREWHSALLDTFDYSIVNLSDSVVKLFFDGGSPHMILSTSPPINLDINTLTLEKMIGGLSYWGERLWTGFSFLSQIGEEKVWIVLDINETFPTTGGWLGQRPTAFFRSEDRWISFRIDEGGADGGGLGSKRYYRYVKVKSVGSDNENKVYVACGVDEDPENVLDDPEWNYWITILDPHLEVWSFDATTGDTLSHWVFDDTEYSELSWAGDGIYDGVDMACTDDSEIVGFAVNRKGDISLRALADPVWYKPVPLETDSTIVSEHPTAVVDSLGNIWVAWDDGKDIYVSSVNISDMEMDETITSIESHTEGGFAKPSDFFLSQNYPNPFNASTTIDFTIPVSFAESKAKLEIYNTAGQKVRILLDMKTEGGEYHVIWDGKDEGGRDVSSGIYFYRLTVDGGRWAETKKMVLIR